MRPWPAPLLLLAPLLLASLSAGATDLVLFNGMLWTGDPARPAATAIAIEDGRIRAVGDDAAMRLQQGREAVAAVRVRRGCHGKARFHSCTGSIVRSAR